MRRNNSLIFRVFFHKLHRVNRRNHQEHKQSLKLLKVSPLLLLVLSGVIIMTSFPQQNKIIGEPQNILPESSGISFSDSMHANQILQYQTYYNITSGSTCAEPDDNDINYARYNVFNTTQEINYDSKNDVLNVKETIDSINYTYIITSASNIPINKTRNYPFDGGWQHNYPNKDTEIKLNAQEVTSAILNTRNRIILDFKFLKNENLEYDDVTIPTKVFNATGNFQANFNDRWDPTYYSTIYEGK